MKTYIINGKIFTPYRVIKKGGIVIEGGKILDVYEGSIDIQDFDCEIIDAKGLNVSPGFIDMHVHGGNNSSFIDCTEEAFMKVAEMHLEHGTTSMTPTVIIEGYEDFLSLVEVYEKVKGKNAGCPDFLGFHIEGPYVSPEQKGAFPDECIKVVDRNEYMKILEHSRCIKNWTIAPELKGAMDLGIELNNRGILASIGHSDAVFDDVSRAFESGFRHVTHLYSCTSMVRRINAFRYAGIVESVYLIQGMTVDIVADGKHLPESLLKLIYNIKGPEKTCLVTDAGEAAGMSEGEIIINKKKNAQKVIIEDGVAKLPDRSAFAGSIATSDMLVKTMYKTVGIPLYDAIAMMTATPARVLGVDRYKGSLAKGMDADVVVFDDDIGVRFVMVKGAIYRNLL